MNPGAGRRRDARGLGRLTDAMVARAVEVHVTESAVDGRRAARAAFARGEGVVACGGDGTVRALAELAAEVDGLLAVVPTGAGNDFARALGLDVGRPLAALAALDLGYERRVDLGRARVATGAPTVFTTVAHSGLDGEVNRWANTVTRLSGTALYAFAALRSMVVYHPGEMSVRVDHEEWSGRAWLVAVANTHCYGGGMRIAPASRIDDALLDVVIVGDVARAEVIAKFPRLIRGTHLGIDGVHSLRGATVVVDGPTSQDLYASGEHVGPLPATITVLPAALRIQVPPPPAGPTVT